MTRNTISENQMKKSKPPVHAGWQEWEDALLWEEVSRVRKAGKPLKSVFEAVSQATGRKANSIRNYYYSKVRERKESGDFSDSSMPEVTAFVPFQEHEVREVLKRVLCAQARGQSVREAQAAAYRAVDAIDFPSGFCRRDIGWREILRERNAALDR